MKTLSTTRAMENILIVGAGVSGLTAGYALAERGCKVTIVEKEDVVGGLAKSFRYGGFTFDIGPHRFSSFPPQIARFVRDTVDGKVRDFPRNSEVYIFDGYHPWPLKPASLFRFPFKVMAGSLSDLVTKWLRRYPGGERLRDYVCAQYGRTIYDVFFKPYTEKFVGFSADHMHSDWVETSIGRAVDRKTRLRNLNDLVGLTMMPPVLRDDFFYPGGGIGVFCERLAEAVRERGGTVITGTGISAVRASRTSIVSVECNGSSFTPDQVIWTAPVTELCRLLGMDVPGLEYLSLILFNLELKRPVERTYQWCYFGDRSVIFNRVSIPASFSRGAVPEGRGSLCVEMTCRENDRRWGAAWKLAGRVAGDLVKMKVIGSEEQISSVHVERVPNAYPVYRLDYKRELRKVRESLSCFSNLTLAGRSGRFWFNNMDGSVADGLAVSGRVCRPWSENANRG